MAITQETCLISGICKKLPLEISFQLVLPSQDICHNELIIHEQRICPSNMLLKWLTVDLQLSQSECNSTTQLKQLSHLLCLKQTQNRICQQPSQWKVNLWLNPIQFLIQWINSRFQITNYVCKKKNI